jgi:type IV secretion system protein VirB9
MFMKLPSPLLPAALALISSAAISTQSMSAQASQSATPTSTSSQPLPATPPMLSPEESRALTAALQNGAPSLPMAQNVAPSVQPTQNGASSAAQSGVPSAAALQAPSDSAAAVAVHRDPPPASADLHAPKDFVENKTVAMPLTGERALRASGAWDATVNPAAMGKDGRVIFAFGGGMPVVVCAPLRVCIIELEHGEHMSAAPHIGDAVRWDVSLESSGSGDQDTQLIVLKPREVGLDTSLFIPTDRRSYYIRLLSKSGAYTPMVAFEYPEDDEAKMQKAILREQQLRQSQVSPVTAPVDALFYDYEIKGNSSFRPLRVMDDGAKTYIEMSPQNAHRDLPTLVIEGPGGNELVNYRVKDNYYIVDRLFDKGALLLGEGKHTEKVEIIRQQKLARAKTSQSTSTGKPVDGSN